MIKQATTSNYVTFQESILRQSVVSPTDIECPEPPLLVNGNVVLSSQVLGVGTTATYSCDPGYVLVGETTRTCGDANRGTVGVWNGRMPSCKGIS